MKRSFTRGWVTGLLLLAAVVFLTVTTQVGGILLLASLPLLEKVRAGNRLGRWGLRAAIFMVVYTATIVLVVPFLASMNGRVPLPWFASKGKPLKPANPGFCLLARNYVRPQLRDVLERVSEKLATSLPGSMLIYLDANFPFLNGFPLLPHLSHKDGKKVDLAYFYRDLQTREALHGTLSPVGYWAYEKPRTGEPVPCQNVRSPLRWDFESLQPLFDFAEMDPRRTKKLLQALIEEPAVQKIFIEPHLKTRLSIRSGKIRFQGCRAARHDDHIHVQIK